MFSCTVHSLLLKTFPVPFPKTSNCSFSTDSSILSNHLYTNLSRILPSAILFFSEKHVPGASSILPSSTCPQANHSLSPKDKTHIPTVYGYLIMTLLPTHSKGKDNLALNSLNSSPIKQKSAILFLFSLPHSLI